MKLNFQQLKEFLKEKDAEGLIQSFSASEGKNIETISFVSREKRIQIISIPLKKRNIMFWSNSKISGIYFDFVELAENEMLKFYKTKFGILKVSTGFLNLKRNKVNKNNQNGIKKRTSSLL